MPYTGSIAYLISLCTLVLCLWTPLATASDDQHPIAIISPPSCLAFSTASNDQHPIVITSPPSCLTSSRFDDSCSYDANKLSRCSYRHCHTHFIRCWDWWTVLDLDCFCEGIGAFDCRSRCPDDLKRTTYYNWIAQSCHGIPSWSGMPQSLDLPSSASILATNFYVQLPTCIADVDKSAFGYSSLATSEVSRWQLSSDKVNYSGGPYQFDQYNFCNALVPSEMLKRSICASTSKIAQSQALIWLNTYCGSYRDFATQKMPTGWQNTIPIYQEKDTDLVLKSLKDPWSIQWPDDLCNSDFDSLVARCDTGTWCSSLNDCNVPISTVGRDCFCSASETYDSPDLDWCGRSVAGQIKSRQYFHDMCNIPLTPVPAGLLLPFTRPIESSPVNATTNLAIDKDVQYPSTQAKLLVFGLVNVVTIILVAILGRRTLINKLKFGLLGRVELGNPLITGVTGVVLHLISNFVNAKLVQRTPGFGDTPVGFFTLLWCTRPRSAWFIVILVSSEAHKAMYFSTTASTLITELVLQVFNLVYMAITTCHGVKEGFYLEGKLTDWFGLGDAAQLLYIGSLLCSILIPFAIAACARYSLSIRNRRKEIPTYICWMEYDAYVRDSTAKNQRATISNLQATIPEQTQSERTGYGTLSPQPEAEQQRRHLRQHCIALDIAWRILQDSSSFISHQLCSSRCQHFKNNRDSEGSGARNFTDNSASLARKEEAKSHAAKQKAAELRQDKQDLLTQIKNNDADVKRLTVRERELNRRFQDNTGIKTASNVSSTSDDTSDTFSLDSEPPSYQSHIDSEPPSYQSHIDSHTRSEPELDQTEHLNTTRRIAHHRTLINSLTALISIYTQLEISWLELSTTHAKLAESWTNIGQERRMEANALEDDGNFMVGPTFCMITMLLVWIGQWLWWAGYVLVARDTYSPPRLVVMGVVWTVFEVGAAILGACF